MGTFGNLYCSTSSKLGDAKPPLIRSRYFISSLSTFEALGIQLGVDLGIWIGKSSEQDPLKGKSPQQDPLKGKNPQQDQQKGKSPEHDPLKVKI